MGQHANHAEETYTAKIISLTGRTEYPENVGYSTPRDLTDIGDDDFITKQQFYDNVPILVSDVVISIAPSAGVFEYTLSPTELAQVNAISKLPVFGAVTNDGQYWAETIKPLYTPYDGIGAYTEIKVLLNSDTATTLVQFS